MDLLKKFAVVLVAVVAVGGSIASGSSSTEAGTSGDSAASTDNADEGSGTTEQKDAGAADEVDDVTLSKCSIDPDLDWPEATLKVVNNSDKPSDYMIEVTFESKDGSTSFGTGNAFIQNLKPGQSKTEKVTGFEDAEGKIKCSVSSVDRMEST